MLPDIVFEKVFIPAIVSSPVLCTTSESAGHDIVCVVTILSALRKEDFINSINLVSEVVDKTFIIATP